MSEQHNLIHHIIDRLFTAEIRRLNSFVYQIIDQNQELIAERIDGITYGGAFYNREGLRGVLTRRPLDAKLWPQMDKHLEDRATVEEDLNSIRMFLGKTLGGAHSLQQIRDAIPDCIIDTCPEWLKAMERCSNITFFFNHERDYRQYDKVLPRIELYSAARLLY